MTIAICAIVEVSRDSQKARNAGIRSGSGNNVMDPALDAAQYGGNQPQ
jgi:hypothetical protein